MVRLTKWLVLLRKEKTTKRLRLPPSLSYPDSLFALSWILGGAACQIPPGSESPAPSPLPARQRRTQPGGPSRRASCRTGKPLSRLRERGLQSCCSGSAACEPLPAAAACNPRRPPVSTASAGRPRVRYLGGMAVAAAGRRGTTCQMTAMTIGGVRAGPGCVRAGPGCVRAGPGCVRAGPGYVRSCVRAGPDCVRAGPGYVRAGPGYVRALRRTA